MLRNWVGRSSQKRGAVRQCPIEQENPEACSNAEETFAGSEH